MIAENMCAEVIEIETDHTPQLSTTNELAWALHHSRRTHLRAPEGSQIGIIVLTLGKRYCGIEPDRATCSRKGSLPQATVLERFAFSK